MYLETLLPEKSLWRATVDKQFLHEFRVFVRRGKMSRPGKRSANIIPRYDSHMTLFVFKLHLAGSVYDADSAIGYRGDISWWRNNKSAEFWDDGNVNFAVPRSFGNLSRLWDSLPIEYAFYIPLCRPFMINWTIKNRRDRTQTDSARIPQLILELLQRSMSFKLKFIVLAY